jgi:hypothetical protein
MKFTNGDKTTFDCFGNTKLKKDLIIKRSKSLFILLSTI